MDLIFEFGRPELLLLAPLPDVASWLIGDALRQPVDQERFGPGETNREEHRETFGAATITRIAGSDGSEGDKPLLVDGASQHVWWGISTNLVDRVSDQQRRSLSQIYSELRPPLLLRSHGSHICTGGDPGRFDHRDWAAGGQHHDLSSLASRSSIVC